MNIALNMIVGQRPESYLNYALESVKWLDEFVIVNTGDENNTNLEIINRVIPNAKIIQYQGEPHFGNFRNLALDNTESDWILWADADEVHFNEFEKIAREQVKFDYDGIKFQFYHFIFDFFHYQTIDPRIILFKKYGVRWTGAVHESLIGLGRVNWMTYAYHHYGYTKPQHEIYENWRLYWSLNPGEYFKLHENRDPNEIITDRVTVAHDYLGKYPEVLKEFISTQKPLVDNYRFIGVEYE